MSNMAQAKNLEQHLTGILHKYRLHDKDTGSPFYLMVSLTFKIKTLADEHLSKHKKDHPAKRTVVRMVAQRKTCQKYMKSHPRYKKVYNEFMSELGLRA